VKAVLIEGLLVALVGAGLSLAANYLSPRGLKLSRNYFPPPPAVSNAPPTSLAPGGGLTTNLPALSNALALRLQARGLSLLDSNQVIHLFHDPAYQQEQVIFIDARDDPAYQAGHIPGAYQLDYYRPEPYLPAVLQAAQFARQIVIYCNGGDCEDSEFAATLLAPAVPPGTLGVYGGGFTEWVTNGLPVEIGGRKSGVFKNAPSPSTAPR